ncbi:UPF0042 nucleotide-binding protein [Lachnospiraceae bacterium PF1-21]|uniref:RNase adapter RapZ n=1 Tax=Ohessyouella blattaphilus TaxID=2949333 RepID=A0ABT1EGX7_9FIRM|nr:RNase adapter RapZ [Ohessyouella blattaphilus]MCP1109017.1 RNase adapter RapZ [Ohessyouella blattaphilus]MCR8562411.1 RNase adapter RapZ [Ohessyouella blattaphilus]MDL2249754.1 RNase adapter RapZ [Lachnospiraceae bacterium OttesenSCG-928-J05]
MKFEIVTGMSGAGKSSALKTLEDLGYYCIDNIPIALTPNLAELLTSLETKSSKVAIGLDVRSGEDFKGSLKTINDLEEKGFDFNIIFLDASDEVLLKRYQETRRKHPLSRRGHRIIENIKLERQLLQPVKDRADHVIDTSYMAFRDLTESIRRILDEKSNSSLFITILSFGFKNGTPADADLLFDVRFLPNPYYIDELRGLTGNDRPVRDYVMKSADSQLFAQKLIDMVSFLLPRYAAEGKTNLVIGIGCTGGKHRSVTLANVLYEAINELGEYTVFLEHRDA